MAWSLHPGTGDLIVASGDTMFAGLLSFGGFYNIQDSRFGGKGDGTDVGPAIQAAVNSAEDGSIVFCPPPASLYLVSSGSEIIFPLSGDNRSITLLAPRGTPFLYNGISQMFTISGGAGRADFRTTIQGPTLSAAAVGSGTGVRIEDARGAVLRDMILDGFDVPLEGRSEALDTAPVDAVLDNIDIHRATTGLRLTRAESGGGDFDNWDIRGLRMDLSSAAATPTGLIIGSGTALRRSHIDVSVIAPVSGAIGYFLEGDMVDVTGRVAMTTSAEPATGVLFGTGVQSISGMIAADFKSVQSLRAVSVDSAPNVPMAALTLVSFGSDIAGNPFNRVIHVNTAAQQNPFALMGDDKIIAALRRNASAVPLQFLLPDPGGVSFVPPQFSNVDNINLLAHVRGHFGAGMLDVNSDDGGTVQAFDREYLRLDFLTNPGTVDILIPNSSSNHIGGQAMKLTLVTSGTRLRHDIGDSGFFLSAEADLVGTAFQTVGLIYDVTSARWRQH